MSSPLTHPRVGPHIRPPNLEVTEEPLHYTGAPWRIFIGDIKLFLKNILYLPWIFFPLTPCASWDMDELYPSQANLIDIAYHCALFVTQLGFLISLLFLFYIPMALYVTYVITFLVTNELICRHFNKGIPDDGLRSTENADSRRWAPHDDESWVFLNGICVGKNWLQHNVDRISRTFHRPVVGIHNKTSGVVFDLVQCLIQRALLYATQDVRDCYVLVKKQLLNEKKRKVILILHSQGGIEGGMIVDWLLDEIPFEYLRKLEVYTFGNLANHFSNPMRGSGNDALPTIPHIEHYANEEDFACRFGVLNYTRKAREQGDVNRFMGHVFVNPRGGHQLNQHYLDSIFPLDKTLQYARKPREGDFMNMEAKVLIRSDGTTHQLAIHELPNGLHVIHDDHPLNGVVSEESVPRMQDRSRLWQYRNGGSPASSA